PRCSLYGSAALCKTPRSGKALSANITHQTRCQTLKSCRTHQPDRVHPGSCLTVCPANIHGGNLIANRRRELCTTLQHSLVPAGGFARAEVVRRAIGARNRGILGNWRLHPGIADRPVPLLVGGSRRVLLVGPATRKVFAGSPGRRLLHGKPAARSAGR